MPRQRKPKPKAVILPPELDDDSDEEQGSVIPDEDGWITLEGEHGPLAEGGRNPGNGPSDKKENGLVRRPARRRSKGD